MGQSSQKTAISLDSTKAKIWLGIVIALVLLSIFVYERNEIFALTLGRNTINSSIVISLRSDKPSPQNSSAIINWTAEVPSLDKESIYYRFLLKGPSDGNTWHNMTGWISNNHWTWKTSANDSGSNEVEVQVRNGNYTGPDQVIAEKIANFTIVKQVSIAVPPKQTPTFSIPIEQKPENAPPNIVKLVPDKSSPQKAGATINWAADASDPDGDVIYYKFLLKSPINGNVWRDMTGWINNNRWIWKTSANESGLNEIKVQVRDGRRAGFDGFDDEKSEEFVLTSAMQLKTNYSMPNSSNKSSKSFPSNLSFGKKGWPRDNNTPEASKNHPLGIQPANPLSGGTNQKSDNSSQGNTLLNGINVKPITDFVTKMPASGPFQYPNINETDYRFSNIKYNSHYNISTIISDPEIQYSIKVYGKPNDRMEHAEQIIGNIEDRFQRRLVTYHSTTKF